MRLRLILSFFLVVLVAIFSTVLIVRLNTPQQVNAYMMGGGMQGLTGLVSDLEAYYQSNGNWQGVDSLFQSSGAGMMGHGYGGGMMSQRIVVADANGLVQADSAGQMVGTKLTSDEINLSIVLTGKNGLTIGYLLANGGMQVDNGSQKPLIARLNNAALQAGLISLVIAVILGIILAEGILRPVRRLTAAAGKVAGGDWSQAVPAGGKDEISGLARSFNAMVISLRQSEERRRGMTADIAHELRTPLAVQRAQIEALQDGIYPLSAENLQPVLDQNAMLTRLVDDLRTLALADAGELHLEMQTMDVGDFLLGMLERFLPVAAEHKVQLTVEVAWGCPPLLGDPDRMAQIFTNLVGNALRYTSEGGNIHLAAACQSERIVMSVSDDGPGIPADALQNVFERFYRADKSRSRSEGGSGLGLAIARQLAQAQGGSLTAENLPQGGARFTLVVQKAPKA